MSKCVKGDTLALLQARTQQQPTLGQNVVRRKVTPKSRPRPIEGKWADIIADWEGSGLKQPAVKALNLPLCGGPTTRSTDLLATPFFSASCVIDTLLHVVTTRNSLPIKRGRQN